MATSDPAERLRVAFELHDVGVEMYRQRVRRERADASPEQIETVVRAWLHQRPGAEFGGADGPGSARSR